MNRPMAGVSNTTQPTVCPEKQIYEIVVDPDRAHLGESFVIDMRKIHGFKGTASRTMNDEQRAGIANNLMKMASMEGIPDVSQAMAPTRVGRAIPNISEINHEHPSNPVPSTTVGPPGIKVFFDMPGLGSISFKYHKVINIKNQIIFVTDKRFGGGAEFYPYCNLRDGSEKKPVGVYVDGSDNLVLLDPSVKGFPIKFDCDPFEFCIVPIAGAKNLDSAMIKELGIVKSSKEEQTNGEASSDRGRDDSTGTGGDIEESYESVEGGFGGVL